MNYSTYRFTLDIHKTKSQVSIPVLFQDTGIQFYINLTDGGKPYKIEEGCTAVFVGKKADGTSLFNKCDIIDGTRIVYTFTDQTTSALGIIDCEIRLFTEEGLSLTTPAFNVVVEERVLKDDEIVESETERTALTRIFESEQARVEAEEARADAFKEIQDNVKGLSTVVHETGDREDAVMSQKSTTDAIDNILHPISYSGIANPVSPAYTKIYVANGITLKKGKSYIFRVTATTNLTTFAVHAYIRRGDTSLYYLNPKAGALAASLRFTATEDLDNVAISIEFSTTSGASAEWSFEEDTHFVVRQNNPSNNASYYAYCNSNNKVDVELLKVSHSKDDWSIVRRYGSGRTRVGEPVENDDATNLKYFNDHTPRFRHTIHSDTSMGNQSYVAFTLNIYSTSSIAFTNETFISALGEKVNDRTPNISVSGCIVENGTKTQIMGLFFDIDLGFVVKADNSSEIRTGLSTLALYDDVVQV
jgi:hypothetical protein